jgi:uncharacterized protein YgbK (DUF1537 family)
MKVYIIADDLTGACDTAAQWALFGLRTVVLLQTPTPVQDVDVVAFDTNTRSSSSGEAYKKLFDLGRELRGRSCDVLFKKIDSTLRGNLGSEIDALNDTLQPRCVLITPAFPQNNRRVVDGKLLLRDGGSSETNVDLLRLLESQTPRRHGLIELETVRQGSSQVRKRVLECLAGGIRYLVLDSSEEEDLRAIAQAGRTLDGRVLWVGSAGLASQIPTAFRLDRGSPAIAMPSCSNVLFLIGSANPVSRQQLNTLYARGNRPTFQLLHSAGHIQNSAEVRKCLSESLRTYGYAALSTPDRRLDVGEAGWVLLELVCLARKTVLSERVSGLVVTGGETARIFLDQGGVNELEILDEVEPGVPLSRVRGTTGGDLFLVTKAGGFGSPEVFLNALEYLSRRS